MRRIYLPYILFSCYIFSQKAYAATFPISTSYDLINAITSINLQAYDGTITANTISINATPITLSGSLPVLTRGATIQANVGSGLTATIDGLGSFQLFSTSKSDLALTNIVLKSGYAGGQGGSWDGGGIGGGGGMGAGGGVYIDLGRTLTLNNSSIQTSTARGGDGGSYGGFDRGGSGGQASFASSTSAGQGSASPTPYGGGNGGSGFGSGGIGGGGTTGGAGLATSQAVQTGGAGGYCGGGGGAGGSNVLATGGGGGGR